MNQMVASQPAPLPLRQIVELQFSGDLNAAHDAYVTFFQNHDPDYSALNLFGVCCVSLGKFEKAERIFEHVVHEAPQIAEARIHLANCRFEQGKMEEALEAFQKVEPAELQTVEVQIVLARVHIALGHDDYARDALKAALTLDPRKPEVLLAMAGIERNFGNSREAMALYKKVLFDNPNNCDALLGQAEIYLELQDWDAVLINCGIVLDQFPAHLMAGALQASALENLGRYEEMLEIAKAMAAEAPDDIKVLTLLCTAYHKSGEFPSCIYAADHVLAVDPKLKKPMTMRASSYFRLGFNEKALHEIDNVLQLYPGDIFALQNKGVILERLLRLDEAIATYDQILEQKPDKQTTRFNKSFCLLLQDNFKEGFKLYESRFNRESDLLPNYRGDEPLWNGEDIEGKHLLVHPEQGFGDTLMACRFIKFLEGRGARITFAVPEALKKLIETLDTTATIISVGANIGKIDFHVPLMSLPHLTADKWNEIPAEPHYLQVPQDAQLKWNDRLSESDSFKIGFVCSGNPNHANDAARSLNMATFLQALPVGPEYHLLQKDLRDTDSAAVSRRHDIITHHDNILDFADTAALCMNMDLVISVDTSVAHLAGALGCPTIVMLSAWPDWRWGLGRVQDIWYPNTRLVRQSRSNNWQDVLTYLSFVISRDMQGHATC